MGDREILVFNPRHFTHGLNFPEGTELKVFDGDRWWRLSFPTRLMPYLCTDSGSDTWPDVCEVSLNVLNRYLDQIYPGPAAHYERWPMWDGYHWYIWSAGSWAED